MRLSIIALVVASACTGTIDGSTTGGPGAPDAGVAPGGGSGSGSGTGSGSGSSSMFPCKNTAAAATLGSGQHNAGQDCMQGCHNHGFTLSGTLYSANGAAALPGATITVTDANGATFDMIAQQNGNFYTKQTIVFPVSVYASACPTSTPMVSKVAADGCSKSGCHAAGAQGAIHL